MSFALTKEQYVAGTKTVTRRLGWVFLNAGDHIMGVEKGMGLKPGEKVVRLGESVILGVRREPLRFVTDSVFGDNECKLEGFPNMKPIEFVAMFCATHKDCTPDTIVTRIEFRRLMP